MNRGCFGELVGFKWRSIFGCHFDDNFSENYKNWEIED